MGKNVDTEVVKPVEGVEGKGTQTSTVDTSREASAKKELQTALLKKKTPASKKSDIRLTSFGNSEDVPDALTVKADRQPAVDLAEAEQKAVEKNRIAVLKEVNVFLDNLGTVDDLHDEWDDKIRKHHQEISSDSKTTEKVFAVILAETEHGDPYSLRSTFFYRALNMGLMCPKSFNGRIKELAKKEYPNGFGNVRSAEYLEGLMDFKVDFTPEQREKMFVGTTLDANNDEGMFLEVSWNDWNDTYSLDALSNGSVFVTDRIFLPPNRKIAELIFKKIKERQNDEPLLSSAIEEKVTKDFIERQIIPEVLNGDQEVITQMLNARNVKELQQLEQLSQEELTALGGTQEGQRRVHLFGEYKRRLAEIDEKEAKKISESGKKYSLFGSALGEKRKNENALREQFREQKDELVEEMNVALRQTFEARDAFVGGLVEDGLLELRLEKGKIQRKVVEGQEEAIKDRAFASAIQKQNAEFFKVNGNERPEQRKTRILDNLKQHIDNRFVGLQKSRGIRNPEKNLDKSEEQQGTIGLGRLFEGLFEGEGKEYLQELLADKEYVKDLLFQYRNEERKDKLLVPVDNFSVSSVGFENMWKPKALKELIELHRKNFPNETDLPIANLIDSINQEVEQELLVVHKGNKKEYGRTGVNDDDPNFGFQNVQTERFDRWKNVSARLGLQVSFDQLNGATPDVVEKINASHELSTGPEKYLQLYNKILGPERVKQMFKEVLAPELISDSARRDEYERNQKSIGYQENYLVSPTNLFHVFKKSGFTNLKELRTMVKDIEVEVEERRKNGVLGQTNVRKLRQGLYEVYQEEIEALLDTAG